MDQIAEFKSTAIGEIARPTLEIYFKLQAPHADRYLANATEHSYGPYSRQKLDVFLPGSGQDAGDKLPCVIFLYGGGLIQGAKRIPPSRGAVYGNVGHYFSSRGFVTVLPDYRLYDASNPAPEGAQYPSGGEDVVLALDWVIKNLGDKIDTNKIFLMGNSAGAVHISTFLYAPSSVLTSKRHPVRGALLLQVPLHFRNAHASREPVLQGYYGKDHPSLSPFMLRQTSEDKTETAIILAERDPEDEIIAPNNDFLALWPDKVPAGVPKPTVLPEIPSHNHISALPALSLGGKEDAWAESVVGWMRERC